MQLGELIKGVTGGWAKQMRREDRDARARFSRRESLARSRRVSLQDAAFEEMDAAYHHASDNGTLPIPPRMIYYAARPAILEKTGRSSLDGQYFSQTLLIKYIRANPATTADWDIVFDARGHFSEPHTWKTFPLGTLETRQYLADVRGHIVGSNDLASLSLEYPTCGPPNRYQAILFVEKEGVYPLLERTQLAERYDLALMSTKGMSVTAARMLVDRLCGEYDIPVLIVRDFDKSGFSIAKTLVSNGPRYTFAHDIRAIDLGVRLADVDAHRLPSERVSYGKKDPRPNLAKNGATQTEIEFLCGDREWSSAPFKGQRVELNAFTGAGLIAWIESKLSDHKIRKVIPTANTLTDVYRWMLTRQMINDRLSEIAVEIDAAVENEKVPKGLARQIRERLQDRPEQTWDMALASIVRDAI